MAIQSPYVGHQFYLYCLGDEGALTYLHKSVDAMRSLWGTLGRKTRKTQSLGNKPAEPGDVSLPALQSRRICTQVLEAELRLTQRGSGSSAQEAGVQAPARCSGGWCCQLSALPDSYSLEKEKSRPSKVLTFRTVACI